MPFNWFKICLYGVHAVLLVAITADMTAAGEFDDCTTFIRIPENEQNRDPNTLSNLTSRPLGFDFATIPFNDPNRHDPCFIVHLNNSKLQSIHVMAHGVGGTNPNFCVKSNLPGDQATCQAGLTSCKDSAIGGNNNIVKYVFYCEGCESDINFWYRFDVSPSFTNGLHFEAWCGKNVQYPDSLIVFPGGETPTENPTSTANGLIRMSWFLLSSFAFHLLYIL